MTRADVLIVGAGLSGLTAASTLEQAGKRVVLVDKGRSVGGRLATRRVRDARVDHGAQFFTVRGEDLAATTAQAITDGVVREWCRGFGAEADGFPRYVGTSGMNGFAKWLASRVDGRIDTGVRIDAIRVDREGVTLMVGDDAAYCAPVTVVTSPVPQTLDLLTAGEVDLPPDVASALRGIEYFATLALLAVLDRAPRISGAGGEQHATGPFTFVADNRRKGISVVPAFTGHAEHGYSLRRYHDEEAEVLADLVGFAQPWFDGARVIEAQLKKWRYAGPVDPHPDRTMVAEVPGGRLVFAGDAFGGPKVEGAFNSGRAAGLAAQ